MSLIIQTTESVFDVTDIKRGDLIRARHTGWDEARNGIVTSVKPDTLTVLFMPGIGNVTNYFTITASEISDGQWEIRWTTDLVTIKAEGVQGDGDD